VRLPVGAAPFPVGRRIDADIAQPAGAAFVAGHPGNELRGEAGHDILRQAESPEAGAGAGDLQGDIRQRICLRRRGYRGSGKPGAGGPVVDDAEQQEAGLAEPGMGEAHQALDVGEVGLGLEAERLQSSASHSTISASVICPRSRPWRSSPFRARSKTVRPG